MRITRTLSDNSAIIKDTTYAPVLYQNFLQYVVHRGRSDNEFGQNGFTIELDPKHTIRELNESNNKATIGFFVPANGTRNIFPANYAVVNKNVIDLTFQNTDLMSGSRSFQVEVDTAATFDSPYLKRQVVTGKVLARLSINLLSNDSTTYFWRTRLATPQPGESSSWTASTFSFINQGVEGWAQLSFAQTADNGLEGLMRYRSWRIFRFGSWLLPSSHGKTIPRYSGAPALAFGKTPTGLSPFIAQHSRRFSLHREARPGSTHHISNDFASDSV